MMRFLDLIEHPDLLPTVPRRLLAGAVVLGLILYCALVGALLGTGRLMPAVGLIGLPAMVIAAAFAIRYFSTLVLVLPLTALAMAFATIPVGNASQLPISMLITIGLAGIWLVRMLTKRAWEVVPTPFNRPLLLFMGACIISFPWGILWADPFLNWQIMGSFRVAQTASLLSFLALMSLPFLVGRFIDRPWKVWFYLWSFIICGTLMTLTQTFSIRQGFLADQGLWGLWFVLSLAGAALVHPGVPWYARLLGLGVLGLHLNLAVLRNSLWLSGWLPTLLGLAAMLFLHSRKIFVLLMVVVLPFAALGPGRAYLEKVAADNVEEGGLGRLEIWRRNLTIASQHWLFGTGPAGYAVYNMTYYRDDARSTHNNYFDILAQFGVVGSALWVWFMGSSLWYGWKTVQRAPPGLARTVAIIATAGWAAAMASMMLGDWVLPFFYNQGIIGFRYTAYSWFFLGLLVVARRMVDEQAGAGQPLPGPANED
mgnify:CR=1 FL=1